MMPAHAPSARRSPEAWTRSSGATTARRGRSIEEGNETFGPGCIVGVLRKRTGESLVLADDADAEDDQCRDGEPHHVATAQRERGADGDQGLAQVHRMADP